MSDSMNDWDMDNLSTEASNYIEYPVRPPLLQPVPIWSGGNPMDEPDRPDGVSLEEDFSRPQEQEFGGVVEHRLQPRLVDPPWLKGLANRCDIRKRKAERDQGTDQPAGPARINPAVPIPGLSVPPAASYGSAHMMSAHYQTYAPEHKKAMNFNAALNTKVLCGRPIQILVLSHEGASYLERDPYLAWLFRPLKINILLGYDAKAKDAPGGPKHFCVIRWFQVSAFLGLPSIAQGRQWWDRKVCLVSLSPPANPSRRTCFL